MEVSLPFVRQLSGAGGGRREAFLCVHLGEDKSVVMCMRVLLFLQYLNDLTRACMFGLVVWDSCPRLLS